MRIGFLVLGVCVLCACGYDASFKDCAIHCSPDTGCPDGLACGAEGLCRVQGASDGCPVTIDAPYTQSECDYMEPNDTLSAAMTATATDMGPAAICASSQPEDRDFYRFTVASAMVTVAIQFTNRPGGDLDIKLYNVSGLTVSQSRSFGAGEMIVCPGASPTCPTLVAGDDYVLEVFSGVAGSVNSYTFSISP